MSSVYDVFWANDLVMAERALRSGVNSNGSDENGMKALTAAVESSREMVALLLQYGADPAGMNADGTSALYHAILKGDEGIVACLLRAGAPLDAVSSVLGDNALHVACGVQHHKIVGIIARKSPSCILDGMNLLHHTPLMTSVSLGDTRSISILLRHGANINVQNEYGESALHVAAEQADESVVKMLIDNGADVRLRDSHGRTALE